MDIEYIKEKIYNLDEQRKIQPGEYLSAEVIDILRHGNTRSRVDCFAKTSGDMPFKNTYTFPSELICSCCGNMTVQHITKTHLFNYLQGSHKIMCDGCKDKANEEKLKTKENFKREIEENTKEYIKNYLDPEKTWDKDIAPKERVRLIISQRNKINYNTVAKYIKGMTYKDFLRTPYWVTISEYKKFKSNYKCALCSGNKDLATHHSSYEKHGYEHESSVMDNDLIVLCADCHSKFHNQF